MKKLKLLLSAVVICGIFFTGCGDKKEVVDKAKNEKVSSASEESVESTEASKAAAEKKSIEAAETEANAESSNDEIEAADDEADENIEDNVQDEIEENQSSIGSYSNENSNITDIAVELHQKGCDMQWDYIIGCPYNLDYDDSVDGGYRVTDVDSLQAIIDEYCNVFAGNGEEITQKYFESDGKVYCLEGGRGANIQYKATELMLVSEDENSALFTAVSHYADPETNEPMDSRSYDFKIVNENGTWKIAEFTLPY